MMRLIRDLLRPYHALLAIIIAAMVVQAAMALAAPWPLKIIIDSVIGNHPVPQWATWFGPMLSTGSKENIALLAGIIVVVVAVVNALTVYVSNYFIESVGQRLGNDLRIRAYHHLQRLSISYYYKTPVGTILSTITSDVTTIQNFASQATVNIFIDSLTVVGMVIVMFSLHWDFALIAIAVLPFLLFFVARVRKAIEKTTKEVRRLQADMLAEVQEGLESKASVEAFQHEDIEEQELAEISKLGMDAAMKARRVRALLGPAVTVPIAMCTAFVLWRGSSLIMAGTMTIGALTVFTSYLAKFFGPVQDLAGQTDVIAQTSVAAKRIQALLESDTMIRERPRAIHPPPFRGEITYDHVSFGYDDSPVLRDVAFTVKPGELVGIVGGTGSGKSTTVSLLPRFYDVNDGSVRIDGVDVRDFKLRGLRSQIGFVLQETVLYRGTVRENIAFGRPNATKEQVIEAAKLANADGFINRMPHGYDSMIGVRGLTLSGGQRQLIGIARALIRNNPILILDEPTAALDAESERVVVDALQRLMKGRTVICIAHRLSTIRDADKIIVIKEGMVAEEGSHDELIVRDGVYADLYHLQHRQESV